MRRSKTVSVDTSKLNKNIIRARVDRKWQEYKLCNFPKGFIEWRIDRWRQLINGKLRMYLGAHCGCVATYGFPRSDSLFHINNAAKGVTFLPKPNRIISVNRELEAVSGDKEQRIKLFNKYYAKFGYYFDSKRLVSLEEFTTPAFQTQTYINQVRNPACSIVFLDFPSYELKTVSQIIYPDDPDISDYEKEVIKYTNMMHAMGHGRVCSKMLITVVYHIVEAFNNTPQKNKTGSRICPK
ncbi:MAG: hypothetical protein ABIH42_00730 [Planctomycetota bacterium]